MARCRTFIAHRLFGLNLPITAMNTQSGRNRNLTKKADTPSYALFGVWVSFRYGVKVSVIDTKA